MEEQEKQRLFEIAGKYEDCVYIEVSSVQSGSTLVYHLGDAVKCETRSSHWNVSGQCTIHEICHRRRSQRIDFRYFPKGFGDVMETYNWSDNIKQAVIKNQRGHSLIFNHEQEIARGRRRYLPQSPIGRDCSVQIAIMGNLCLQWGGRLLGHK